ncbi:hypothetical protein ABL78_7899 [Leptomonas seymouri]|uniref:Uncharacterized protein n=1 Tax=Leptomonas seymouri TaxID=5684 RepID=A0A0N0P2L0_LEPSE|nr:hypothetical protein ABL78_7899 [Leptomonas seymouri]|eukprot:KPI83076.1 hypothetical protein ABL78_7899 [Leptomonas seymouri]
MELQATMALDRDAVNTVTLRLLPPSTAPTSATCWLLLHTIPITASLSRTLSRLVSIEEAAMSQPLPELTSSSATVTAAAVLPTRLADMGTARGSASRHTTEQPSPSSSPNSSGHTSLDASFARMQAAGCVELVRVGYIVSEIHAYCILLKCHSPPQAVRMKAALEEGAALGVTAPVEFVSDARPVTITRRTFAEAGVHEHVPSQADARTDEQRSDGATGDASHPRAAPTPAAPPPFPQQEQQQGRPASGDGNDHACAAFDGSSAAGETAPVQRWRTGVHSMPLLDAATMIFPVRDNDDVADDEGGFDADDRSHDGRPVPSLRRSAYETTQQQDSSSASNQRYRSQLHSPYQPILHRPSGDQALSPPSSPPFRSQKSPVPASTAATAAGVVTPPMAGAARARGAMTGLRGAAPPPPPHSRLTAASTASRASPSPPYAQSNQHTHTPLHLPMSCGGDACTTPQRLDGSTAKNHRADMSWKGGHAAEGLLPTAGGCLSGEFCAICQVDPLRSAARVTTLCQHSFHLHCYAQLPSGSAECPLCRFSVYDLLNDARCEVCGTYEDLWVCLICGHIACGRARRDHQQQHYRSSGHSCSWQSSTNRIWNLSSRMFLHQEVALLLDGAEEAQPVPDGHHTSAPAADGDGGELDPLRHMSWAEPFESDLQEALNESKEEAVARYYTEALGQLAEEQRRYYEPRLANLRSRRERQRWRADALKTEEQVRRSLEEHEMGSQNAERQQQGAQAPPLYASVYGVVREERRQRRRVLAEYAPAMVSILQLAQRAYTTLYNSLKSTRDDAQQQVLLRSHFNSGLVAQMELVQQRTHEAAKKGERSTQAKRAEEAALQRSVEEALSAL